MTKLKYTLAFAATLAVISTSKSIAAGDVTFAGAVTSECTLLVGVPGTLVSADNNRLLTSTGATAGSIQALSTGIGFGVSVDKPTAFSIAPSGGDDNVTFGADYALSGVTNQGLTDGAVPTLVNVGVTDVTVNMTATKSSGVFPSGAYTAVTTVRCE